MQALLCTLALQHAGFAATEVRLLDITATGDAAGVRVELRMDGATPGSQPFRLDAPSRLVLDLPGVVNATGAERFEIGRSGLARVRLGRHAGFLRVVLDLEPGAPAAERLEANASGLVIALGDAALPAVGAGPPADPPVRIYGVELQAAAERDRVLVFAEHAIAAELVTLDADTVELRIPGATLAASATRRIKPDVGGAVSDVVVFEPAGAAAEVRIQIERSAGVEPELSRRGAILAVEFPLPDGARSQSLTLSFVDTELPEVVRGIAKATGASFLFDDRLKGRVTLSVVNRVTPAEAIEILHAALLSQGFAAVPSPGGAWRILPAGEGKGAAPVRAGGLRDQRVAPVTTLVRLHNAVARDLVAALGQLAGSEVLVAAYEPSNSMILAGSETKLKRYLTLAQALDDAESEELVVLSLRHRDAAEVAAILREAAPPARTGQGGVAQPRFEIWHDERTNSVLMRAPAPRLAELRAWLAQLDRPPAGQGTIRVIRPLYADATGLAETLTKLARGDPGTTARAGPSTGVLSGRSFQVAVHESTGALLVEADPETHSIVRWLVDEIDRRPPSVVVDLLVLEITTERSLALGFDAFLPFGDAIDPDESFAGALSVQSNLADVFEPVTDPGVGFFRYAREPLLIPIIGPGGVPTELLVPREIVQVTAAEGQVTARTLLRPHLVALSGEEHELVAGDNVPVLIGATDEAGTPVQSDPLTIRNDIERRDVGMILRVRPSAGQAGDVRLDLEVEASRVRPLPGDVATRIGPVIEQRTLSAVASLQPGRLAVLGMALDHALVERDTGVPFLKDIPILGWWARSTVTERAKRTLLIAVQAGIERGPEARLADSVRQRLAFERTLARRGELASGAQDDYALLVTTRSNEVEAEGVASALRHADAGSPRVVRWEFDGEPRFDVYLGGFATIHEAAAAADPLLADGWKPDLVVLPPRAAAPLPAKQE